MSRNLEPETESTRNSKFESVRKLVLPVGNLAAALMLLLVKKLHVVPAEQLRLAVGIRGKYASATRFALSRAHPKQRMLGVLELRPFPAFVAPQLSFAVASMLDELVKLFVCYFELCCFESADT